MFRHLLAASALVAAFTVSAQAAAPSAGAFVSQIVTGVNGTIKNPALSRQAKADALKGEFVANFDMPTIGQFVLGSYWKTATPADQSQFVELFTGYLVNQYSTLLNKYELASFTIDREQASGRDIFVASTVQGGSSPVHLDWRLQQGAAGYKVVDVKVEGLSISQQQRSEIGAVLSAGHGDVPTLLARLREKQTASR